MKQTLYQILGVDAQASMQEIEAAYARRLAQLQAAAIQDPGKLVALQQSKEILCDANRRAAYDATLAAPVPNVAPESPKPALLKQWGKWIAVAAIVLMTVWWKYGAGPSPQTPPPMPAAGPVEPAPEPVPLAKEAAAPAAANNMAVSEPPAAPPQQAESSESRVLGAWTCTDAITGRTSRYNFLDNAALSIATSDGQTLDYKYELGPSSLQITDARQTIKFAIEESGARKMVLNFGTGGQRVVCKR